MSLLLNFLSVITMIVSKSFITAKARRLITTNPSAKEAFQQIQNSITSNHSSTKSIFEINNKEKHGNGVVPIKEGIYKSLEEKYQWFREKPLDYFKNDVKKGGPIDVYKAFRGGAVRVGVEFETGNISSAHRSLNKLALGIIKAELDLAVMLLPVSGLAYFLTDRVSNYEELEPYFVLFKDYPFVILGFDADKYSASAPVLPKGRDGMSQRKLNKWKD